MIITENNVVQRSEFKNYLFQVSSMPSTPFVTLHSAIYPSLNNHDAMSQMRTQLLRGLRNLHEVLQPVVC